MTIPVLFGKPIFVWLGILLFILLVLQILTGKQIIKLPFIFHRGNAMLLFFVALIHAFFALGLWFFGFKIA